MNTPRICFLSFIIIFQVVFSISCAQEKEFKQVHSLIERLEKTTPTQQDLIELIQASDGLIANYPANPLGHYTRSKYYALSKRDVDSAFFIMLRSRNLFARLDEKTQAQYCKKFDICKENFVPLLDTLINASLAHYSQGKPSNQLKVFLQKYPKEYTTYQKAEGLYEKQRYEELNYSIDISLYQDFLHDFPDSKYVSEVNTRVEKLEYNELSRSRDTTAFINYLKKYPNSPQKTEIEQKINELREYAIYITYIDCSRSKDCLMRFLNKYPYSKHSKDAFKEVKEEIEQTFITGHKELAIKEMKNLRGMNLNYNEIYNLDSIIDAFEFGLSKYENNVGRWNYFIQNYSSSPNLTFAIHKRDSLVYFKLIRSSKQLSEEQFKGELEAFITNYPKSDFVKKAQAELDLVYKKETDKKREEEIFLSRYALYNQKVVRLFVCHNVAYDTESNRTPKRTQLANSSEDIYRNNQSFEHETGDFYQLWQRHNYSSETYLNFYYDFRDDSITHLRLKIMKDYGINTDKFPTQDINDHDLTDFFQLSSSKQDVIENYVTTSVTEPDEAGFFYITGFFVNQNHYQKDLDCFIAKINSKETALSKKVVWLKEFNEQTSEGTHFNNWGADIQMKGQHLYVKTRNQKGEFTFLRYDSAGKLIWSKKLTEIEPRETKITILSNGNLLVLGIDANSYYSTMNFVILNSANAQVIKLREDLENHPWGDLGVISTINNEFIIVINYIEYREGHEVKKSIGRAINLENTVSYILPNTMILKYNNNGELVKQKIFKTVEPRYIDAYEMKGKTILFKGYRGKDSYDGKYLNTFLLEIDTELNVISSNGAE